MHALLDLQTIRQSASQIAREAAKVLIFYYERPELQAQAVKSNVIDLVTEADKASEAVILPALQAAFPTPTYHIVSEESGSVGEGAQTAEYIWYIDPLDGTTNFANSIPYFAVSIGLATREGEPLVGVVYNPVSDELFSAAKGHGATLNERPIAVSRKDDLIACVIASGFPYTKAIDTDNNLREWRELLIRTRDLRRMGSAALDLSSVACGRYDGYWEQRINLWDFTAGIVIVREAGGMVTDYNGGFAAHMPQDGRIIASNGRIHPKMLEIIALARAGL